MKRLLFLVSLLLSVHSASAQGLTCNGRFEVSYPFLAGFVDVGDSVTMRLALGAGPVIGGSAFFTNNVDVELSCDSDFPIVPVPCVAEGTVKYLGDQTITTNCTTCRDVSGGIPGVPTACNFTSDNPAGGASPNDVHFLLPTDVFLRIPENSVVPYCFVDIGVQKIAESTDQTPNLIEQNSGYLASPTANCPDCFAVCDNFILASQVTQSSALIAKPSNEAFQCYEAPRRDTHKPNKTVTVTDQFGSDTVRALRIHPFCAPTNLNNTDPLAPQNPVHNAGYVLDGVNPAAFAQPTVAVTTALGAFSLRVGSPQWLFVPTAKSVLPAPPPAPLVTPTNHYLCHRALDVTGPNVKGTSVTEQDQFITFTQRLSTVSSLCAPTQKNNTPIVDPTKFLLCFNMATPKNAPTPLNVRASINNQFGTAEIDLTQALNLCVAATVQ